MDVFTVCHKPDINATTTSQSAVFGLPLKVHGHTTKHCLSSFNVMVVRKTWKITSESDGHSSNLCLAASALCHVCVAAYLRGGRASGLAPRPAPPSPAPRRSPTAGQVRLALALSALEVKIPPVQFFGMNDTIFTALYQLWRS